MARKVYTDLSDTIAGWRVNTNTTAEHLGDLDSLDASLASTSMVAAVNSALLQVKGFDSSAANNFLDSDYVKLRADSSYVRSAITTDYIRPMISVTDQGGDGSLGYDSGTGVITYTGPSASEVRSHFSAGTGISIVSGQISADVSNITINNLSGADSNILVNHSTVNLTAGNGLTGGGDITTSRTFAVGAGTGVTVNADDVAIGQAVETTSDVQFNSVRLGTNFYIRESGSNLVFLHGTTKLLNLDASGNLTAINDVAAAGTI